MPVHEIRVNTVGEVAGVGCHAAPALVIETDHRRAEGVAIHVNELRLNRCDEDGDTAHVPSRPDGGQRIGSIKGASDSPVKRSGE